MKAGDKMMKKSKELSSYFDDCDGNDNNEECYCYDCQTSFISSSDYPVCPVCGSMDTYYCESKYEIELSEEDYRLAKEMEEELERIREQEEQEEQDFQDSLDVIEYTEEELRALNELYENPDDDYGDLF